MHGRSASGSAFGPDSLVELSAPPPNAPLILVADDVAANVELLFDQLAVLGFRAIAASDHTKMKQSFRRYRSQAGNRFYRIDSILKELCDELRQIDGPLAFVVRMLE